MSLLPQPTSALNQLLPPAPTTNPLPSSARLAFEGEIFQTWQWDQPMYDGSIAIFEKLKRSQTVMIIATVGDKLILQDQTQPNRPPFISLPCGRCDAEDPTQLFTAKRELQEETGYTCDNWLFWRSLQPYNKVDWTVYTFIARNCQKTAEINLDAGEKITTYLVSFDQFLELAENPAFQDWDLKFDLLKAKYDPAFRQELHKVFFG